MDVPLRTAVAESDQGAAESTDDPGAQTSRHGPWFE